MLKTNAIYQKQIQKTVKEDLKMTRVLTGGAYDLLHSGHVLALQKMKKLGDYLIVNINPDYRIKEKKGEHRPILSEKERLYIMLQLKSVDEVCCIKGEPTQGAYGYVCTVLDTVQPDVYASSTNDKSIVDFCRKRNIKFVHIPDIPGFDNVHSEGIVRKIKKMQLNGQK